MPLRAWYDIDNDVVRSEMTGSISPDELHQETLEMGVLATRFACGRFLSDYSKASVAFSMLDVYRDVDMHEDQGVPKGAARIAVIPPGGDVSDDLVQFYRALAAQQGWDVDTFTSPTDAMAWLTEP